MAEGRYQMDYAQINIRLPKWMLERFKKTTKAGERSHLIRKIIMEIIKDSEEDRRKKPVR